MDDLNYDNNIIEFLDLFRRSRYSYCSFDYVSFCTSFDKHGSITQIIDYKDGFSNFEDLGIKRNLKDVYINFYYIGSLSILIELANWYNKMDTTVHLFCSGLIAENSNFQFTDDIANRYVIISPNFISKIWCKLSKSRLALSSDPYDHDGDNVVYDLKNFKGRALNKVLSANHKIIDYN